MQDSGDSLEALCSVLPSLAYGDMSQEAWQDVRAGDCIHFIQLAQRALRYMLSEAEAAHMSLVRHMQNNEMAVRYTKCFPAWSVPPDYVPT